MCGNWLKNLTRLISGLCLAGSLQAQGPVVVTSLPETVLNLKAKNRYFLSDVLDKRKRSGILLGHIINKTNSTRLDLDQSLENAAFRYWSRSLPDHGQEKIPLVVRINSLYFSENRVAPGKVKGESAVAVDFFWYRNKEIVPLTTYKARSEYTRPEHSTVHEAYLDKMLGDAMVYFDKWMTANDGKNIALVRGVRLTIEQDDLPAKADTVFYNPERPLVYSDFKAAPKPGKYAAMVFTSISYEGSSSMSGNYLDVLVKLKVYLVKSMSWMHPESRNPAVLKHEQTHFDIARISAERFKKKLSALPLTLEDHDSEIQYQFLDSYREMHELQKAYDSETRHGLHTENQRRWEEMVSRELADGSKIRIQ